MVTPIGDAERQVAGSQPPQPPRSRSLRLAVSIVAGLVLFGLAMLLISRIQTANTQAHNVPKGAIGMSLVGKSAPDVAFTAWTVKPGQQMSLSSLRGHPVVLNFWEASCDPCKAEAPLFAQANKTYAPQGVIFVGVALYTSQADGEAFLNQHGLTYLAGVATTNQTVVDYSLIGVPDTYFINSNGKIVAQNVGQITQQTLTSGIQSALK
ncbi:MAG TPA: TlpA disulfide reductase family protein [Ktedonobacterales bacterium]|jgi:cytochrome c biogenesis protein CcmG/thiol:disulfide interchange protein DsbE|nr:TlpA disulfide reductase family protein [Ktedonobacterales bacterium]